jgi:hypothetical protein
VLDAVLRAGEAVDEVLAVEKKEIDVTLRKKAGASEGHEVTEVASTNANPRAAPTFERIATQSQRNL